MKTDKLRKARSCLLYTASSSIVTIMLCSSAAAGQVKWTEDDILKRLDALEQSIKAREKALEYDRKQLEQIKSQVSNSSTDSVSVSQLDVAPHAKMLPPPSSADGICSLTNKADFDLAFANPNSIEDCGFSSQIAQARRAAGADNLKAVDNYSGIPGRVGQALGLRGEVNFAGGDEASISYTYGIKGRKTGRDNEYQRPILQKITGTISTPISSGKNRLVSFNDGFDVTSGTSIKLSFDYQAFEKEEKRKVYKRSVSFLNFAREACEKDQKPAITTGVLKARQAFVSRYEGLSSSDVFGNQKEPWSQGCTGYQLINWIFKTSSSNGEEVLVNKEFAAKYINLFWDGSEEAPIPQLGWGVSVEYAPQDFGYLQGTFPVASDGSRSFDRTVALIKNPLTNKAFSRETDSWVLEGYGSAFKKLFGVKRPKIRIYPEGIMGIASIKYASSYNFPSDAKDITICDIENPAIILADCDSLNIDRPRKRSDFFGGIEGRLVFRNIPIVDLVGIAPKFEYRFDDGLKSLDVPLYVSVNDKGIGTSGVRLRGNWGGRDLLGNPLKKDWGVSIFYSASLDFLVK